MEADAVIKATALIIVAFRNKKSVCSSPKLHHKSPVHNKTLGNQLSVNF